MYAKMLIMNWTYRIGLPLKVRSTALQLSDKLEDYFKDNVTFESLYEKECFKAETCIFLGCKFEDVHGHLDKILERIRGYNGFKHFELIIEKEIEILEFLSFNFDFANLYQAAYAISLVAGNEKRKNATLVKADKQNQESSPENKEDEGMGDKEEIKDAQVKTKSKWESLLNRVNLSLMVADLNKNKQEAILAAFPNKIEFIKGNEEIVKEIRNKVKGFVFYNESQLKERLDQA